MISIFLLLILNIFFRHVFYWRVKDEYKFQVDKTVFHSHRGYKKNYPENSLEAILNAEKIGFQWVEFDIMGTADGHLVCSHNFDLERETNGKGYIHKLNKNDLKYINNGVYDKNITPSKLCFLDDVIKKTSNKLKYNIEIKAPNLTDLSTARALGKIIDSLPIDRIIISSFNPLVLMYFKIFHKKIKTGFLYQNREYLWVVHIIHPAYIHPRADLIDDELFTMCKLRNLGINAWTVNNYPAIQWCKQNNLDGVITDLEVCR